MLRHLFVLMSSLAERIWWPKNSKENTKSKITKKKNCKYSEIISRYNTLWHEVEIIMKFKRIEQRKQKKKRKKNYSTKRGPRRSNNRLSRKKWVSIVLTTVHYSINSARKRTQPFVKYWEQSNICESENWWMRSK